MKLHQLDLNLLLAFDALMTQGSVTRAAESLFISQPAMSHALGRLRTAFGDQLLVRTPQGMVPTPRAQHLHSGVRQALRLLEQQLSEEEAFDPQSSRRRFVLCTTDYVECVLMPPLMQRLNELAPGVSIEIRILRDRLPEAELASGEIDLVLGFDEYMQVPAYLGKETWLTEPLAGLVRKDLPGVGEQIALSELIGMAHVFHSPLGTSEARLDNWLESQGLSRRISVNSQSYMSAAAIVCRSDYLLVLPKKVADLLAEHWPMKRLQLPEDVPGYHLNCVWHPALGAHPALIWLRSLMKTLVSG
ncbi:LysR family transcriptional regulator [Shewanella litorisediminis]|uniref:LysR family transcriptional regulator n=1 Tax=Shewanella litorisediminis TaxID=1173586 RepID=A0ABX7G0F0_9GAMM|nr:LysR family transcriptional regulator [Shewanella litorisediminis]MCL2918139.1 LysR family transcriptional regulator [Shewanella litorisediminis]QRH00805.1 LysR family transcriptional regulator [Shewanella litorisediminis]